MYTCLINGVLVLWSQQSLMFMDLDSIVYAYFSPRGHATIDRIITIGSRPWLSRQYMRTSSCCITCGPAVHHLVHWHQKSWASRYRQWNDQFLQQRLQSFKSMYSHVDTGDSHSVAVLWCCNSLEPWWYRCRCKLPFFCSVRYHCCFLALRKNGCDGCD